MLFLYFIYSFIKAPGYFVDKVLSLILKKMMKEVGKNVSIKPRSSVFYGLKNLSIGDNVIIPKYSHIFCTDAPLTIGNNVLFGPSPTIVTGNHRIDKIGEYIFNVYDKLSDNDKEVVIQDDVWVGANVTILMGVIIGRGSIVAAGSVVNKSCPPYSIVGGVPAKILKFRFTIDEILEHEKMLYSIHQRFSKDTLTAQRNMTR